MVLNAGILNLVNLFIQTFVSFAFIQENGVFLVSHFLIFIKDRISVSKEISNIFLGIELKQCFYLYFLLLAKLLNFLLDILQFFQSFLCVLVDSFLLFVLAHAVSAVPKNQPNDLSVGLTDLALQLLNSIMEGSVAGIWNLPIGISLELQQQFDQLDLTLSNSSDKQGLIGSLSIDLYPLKHTNDASLSKSTLKIFSDSSLPLF